MCNVIFYQTICIAVFENFLRSPLIRAKFQWDLILILNKSQLTTFQGWEVQTENQSNYDWFFE